jgi:hypothetical protein
MKKNIFALPNFIIGLKIKGEGKSRKDTLTMFLKLVIFCEMLF